MGDNLYSEDIMGLHSFRNPQDAWNVICANWRTKSENMAILDDKRFCQVIVERAIMAIVGTYIDKYSENWLNDALCIGNVETDYLIYQNFFYYSEATGKFYTSIVETDNCYYLGNYTEIEKRIVDELYYIHDINFLVKIAINFVSDNSCLFELYNQDEVMDAFLDLYWEHVA